MHRWRSEEYTQLKRRTKIGIYGAFSKPFKDHLLCLKSYLTSDLNYCARISEDLENELTGIYPTQKSKDSALSKLLIETSNIHILVFPSPLYDTPHHYDQSVTAEFIMIKERKKQHIIILCQNGLRDDKRDCFGSVIRGELDSDDSGQIFEIIDYDNLDSEYFQIAAICARYMKSIWLKIL